MPKLENYIVLIGSGKTGRMVQNDAERKLLESIERLISAMDEEKLKMFTSLSCTFLNSTDTMPSPYSGDGFSFCISSTSIFAISANICHWSTDNLDITEIRRCLKSGSPLSRSPKMRKAPRSDSSAKHWFRPVL